MTCVFFCEWGMMWFGGELLLSVRVNVLIQPFGAVIFTVRVMLLWYTSILFYYFILFLIYNRQLAFR